MHETRAYRTQYHLTDQFFRFWFQFIEPAQGQIDFGNADVVVASIMARLPDYLGPAMEAVVREWLRLASAAGVLPEPVGAVGTWWDADHQLDLVGLDAGRQVAVVGECKWRNQGFRWDDLQRYLGHVQALAAAAPVRPDALHVLISKQGFDERVQTWAAGTRARLLGPAELLAPW